MVGSLEFWYVELVSSLEVETFTYKFNPHFLPFLHFLHSLMVASSTLKGKFGTLVKNQSQLLNKKLEIVYWGHYTNLHFSLVFPLCSRVGRF